jgi:hypothetical protein
MVQFLRCQVIKTLDFNDYSFNGSNKKKLLTDSARREDQLQKLVQIIQRHGILNFEIKYSILCLF